MDTEERKRELRAQLRAARAGIAPERVRELSAALTAHVRAAPMWREATAIAGFVGVRKEPDTRALLEAALAEGKALWLPRVLGPSELGFVRVRSLGVLAPGGFGLLEPPPSPDEPPVPLTALDVELVLVPGLAFAANGARIGFGRGYYDRTFAEIATSTAPLRLGLCFAEFFDRTPLPVDPRDVPVHAVATEHGLATCHAPA